jgi:two-component sensor histidine kinase
MARYFSTMFWVYLCVTAYAQPNSAEATLSTYTSAQKRVLVLNTAKFINIISQNNFDKDSVVLMACSITGVPFLTAHGEDTVANTGSAFINVGKIDDAVQLVKSLSGEKRLQLLVQLATWYIHKPGEHRTDLDSANLYIQDALTTSLTLKSTNKRYECLNLLAEYHFQAGDAPESKKILLKIISSVDQDEDKRPTAMAFHHLALMDSEPDSVSLLYLSNSLSLYRQLKLREKEMEVLWDMAEIKLRSDFVLMENDLLEILRLAKSTGYRHSMFAEYLLSFIRLQQTKYLDALQVATAAYENLNWAGLSELSGSFNMRIGVAYSALGKNEEALEWYKKGLENRTEATHIFWFKSLLYAATLLQEQSRYREALSLMREVTTEFPPSTLWEKAQVLTLFGGGYEKEGNYKLADEYYRSYLKLVSEFPQADPYGELGYDCIKIANFYTSRSNVEMARLCLEKIVSAPFVDAAFNSEKNYALFRFDSLTGNYESAMEHHIQYKLYADVDKAVDQRKQLDEMTLKYESEKKDQDIKLLESEKEIQESRFRQARYTRNWILGSLVLLLIAIGLLIHNVRLKQRTNKKLALQQDAIVEQNGSLRHLVNEKEWLVKEIHHRVKNNLQTITSLLGTQSEYLKNEVAIAAIADSQRRIQSMSLIHQKLYQTENLSAVNMQEYIYELIDFLSSSFSASDHVRVNQEIQPIELNIAHCIPLGLIINEAITNSFKYAFPDDQRGIISISLKNAPANQITLTIHDNGKGLPLSFSAGKSNSMGMNMMRGLSDEIGAQFNIESRNGTCIVVNFKYEPDSEIEISNIGLKTIRTS